MSAQRSKKKSENGKIRKSPFLYSSDQVAKAIAPRALPIYSEEEEAIQRDLLHREAQTRLDRIKGGQTDRGPAKKAAERQAAIVEIYRQLSPSGEKHPTNSDVLTAIIAGLKGRNIHASEDTIKYDLKILGAARLRKAAKHWDEKPWYPWAAPDDLRSRRKRREKLSNSLSTSTQNLPHPTLSEKTRQEMKAGRDSLIRNRHLTKGINSSSARRKSD